MTSEMTFTAGRRCTHAAFTRRPFTVLRKSSNGSQKPNATSKQITNNDSLFSID